MSIYSPHLIARLLLPAILMMPVTSFAQSADCPSIASNSERLACYDLASRRPVPMEMAQENLDRQTSSDLSDKPATYVLSEPAPTQISALADRWELDVSSKRGILDIRPYKPVYILPVSYTDHVNKSPSSSAPGHSGATQQIQENMEVKMQLSVKTKVVENMFGDNGDLWLGYTQSSRWQAYNKERSRPFRETNYEPEAMMVFRTDYELLGFKGSMASIGLNHQSNGRSEPLSRSWNRIIAQVGFERDDWMVMLRPWWRLPENNSSDDNPGIENYMGRGELLIAHKWEKNVLSFQGRHSLRGGDKSRGSAQLAWSFPISGVLKGYVQAFTGYGESLIDFDHRQNVVGFGLSVADWF